MLIAECNILNWSDNDNHMAWKNIHNNIMLIKEQKNLIMFYDLLLKITGLMIITPGHLWICYWMWILFYCFNAHGKQLALTLYYY